MPKIMNMKIIKITALKSIEAELAREETRFLILGNAFILRKGRSTLKVRSDFTCSQLNSIISMMPVITTMKSSQFHLSRIYALKCKMNP